MTFQVILLCLLTLALVFIIYKYFIKPIQLKNHYSKQFRLKGFKIYEYPYKVHTAPFYQNMIDMYKEKQDTHYYHKHIYSNSYDLVISNVLNHPQIVFFNQKLIKQLLSKDNLVNLMKGYVSYEAFYFIIKRSIAFAEKQEWKNRKKIISKVFNFQFIVSQIPLMIKISNLYFQSFQQQYWDKHPQGRNKKHFEIQLYQMMTKFTSSIVVGGILGLDSIKQQLKGEPIQEQILKLSEESMRISKDPIVMALGFCFVKYGLRQVDRDFLNFNKQINQVLLTYIRKIRNDGKTKQNPHKQSRNLISLLLEEIEMTKGKQQEVQIRDLDLVDDIKAFVIGGSQTSSNYLTMLLLFIYQKEQVLLKLRNQIDTYIKSDEDITLKNIKKIQYLDCVMTQTSRLFASAQGIFQRILIQDTSICGINLKEGLRLLMYTKPMFYNPQTFPNPFQFIPERWQKQQSKALAHLISYQFGGGPRSCIGKYLALTETKVMVIKFIQRYKSLIEPNKSKRCFEEQLSTHLMDSQVILTLK